MAVIWDPSISYSSGGFAFETTADGLTAWMTGGGSGYFLFANKTIAPNTGKYYWEFVWFGSIGECGMAEPGITAESYGGNYRYREFNPTTPQIASRNPGTGSAAYLNLDASMNASIGNTMMFAYDSSNGHFWYGLNGTWYNSGDPASDTNFTVFANNGGYSYQPMATFDTAGQTSQSVQINTITTNYAVPTGFSTLDLPPPKVALPRFSYNLDVLGAYPGQYSERYTLKAKDVHTASLVQRWGLTGNAVWSPVVTAVHYRLTLRAAGFADLELPMKSFQSRLRHGTPSYLEVVVPGYLDFIDSVTDRAAGELVVEMGTRKTDGTTSVIEVARVDLETPRYDRGSGSTTGTLTGHQTNTYNSPKTVVIPDHDLELISKSGSNRIRCKVIDDLFPRDTVVAGGLTFDATLVQRIVGTDQAYMEISDG